MSRRILHARRSRFFCSAQLRFNHDKRSGRRFVNKAVRPILEQLEQRVYLSLTAGIPTRIDAAQFQNLDAGDITDSTQSGSVYIPAGANVTVDGLQETSLTVAGKLVISSAAALQNQSRITTLKSLIFSNGTLDLTNNQLFINYGTGTDPISSIQGDVISGYAGSAWNGAGIDSSTAAANAESYGLGYADADESGDPTGLPAGEIEVQYTLLGDANMDGTVNSEDFTPFSNHFGQSGQMWDDGDFNYDGTVNAEDFTPFSHNLGQSSTTRPATSYVIPPQYVATFTDTSGTVLSKLGATINWGDGSAPTLGAIVADGGGGSGTFHVVANHDFLEAGTYQISTTITDNTISGSPVIITMPGTVVVAPSVFASTSKPAGLTATPLDAHQIELTWADVPILNLNGSTGLELDVSTDPTFPTGGTTPYTLSSHVTAFVASGLTASTPYYFRIRSNLTGGVVSETATASTKASTSPAAPTITVGASKTLNLNQTAVTLSMTATAPGSDSLAYSWQTVSSPLGLTAPTFTFTGSEQTSVATLFGAGTYVFRGVATDSTTSSSSIGLSATSDVVVTVNQITSGVDVTVNNLNVSPGVAGVANGDTRLFKATAVDQFGVSMASQPTFTWSLATTPRSGESVSSSGLYHAPNTGTTAGTATVEATTGSLNGTATVETADPTTGGPVVSIQGVSGSITQTATVSIIADSPNDTLSSYSLTLTPLDGGSAITLASGTSEVGAGATSTAVAIATINPDLLQQGDYTLTLSATDAAGTHPTSEGVQISSQLKLGNFNLPVTDLTINTPGIPLTVSRVYDSTMANQNHGDFGPGWLALNDVNFTTTAFPGRSSAYPVPGGYPALKAGDLFYFTLPGGQVDAFTFSPVDSGNFNGLVGGEIWYPAFAPANGNHDSLTVDTQYDNNVQDSWGENQGDLGNSIINLYQADDGTFYTNFDGSQNFELDGNFGYNPASEDNSNQNNPSYGGKYVLSTQQGITYTIDGPSGRISSEKDLNGNTITFNSAASPTSITYTPNISGEMPTTINITRSGGHITEISDPNGGDIQYGYTNGDLTSVTQRDNESNGTRDVTSYAYLGTTNLMTKVTDAFGANLFVAAYGTNGGLSSLTDVYGNPVPIQIAASGSSNSVETTTDLLGNTTEEEYNSNGQLLRTIKQVIDPLNPAVTRDSVVIYQYNDSFSNLVTLQSNPFFSDAANALTTDSSDTEFTSPPPNGWQIDRGYDGNGNMSYDRDWALSTMSTPYQTAYSGYISYNDPNGGSVEILGKPESIIYPISATMTIGYDGSGNVHTSTDGTGQETEYDHNSAGEVTNTNRDVSSTLQLLSTNAYNSLGQLTGTTDYNYLPNGTQSGSFVHNYVYDSNWNQTLSYYYNSTNNQTVVDRMDYDSDDRVKSTEHYVLSGNQSFTASSQLNSDTPLTTTSTTYNADGKMATATDEYGRVTYYDYDVKGNLIRTVYPNGTEVRSVFDVLGRLLVQTDQYYTGATSLSLPPNNIAARATLNVYDAVGRLEETDRLDNVTVNIEQDPDSNVPSGIDIGAWNGQGSLISRAQTIYNSAGQIGAQIGTDGQTTSYTYLDDGKVSLEADALGDVTHYAYSVNTTNHLTSTAVTDPNSHTTTTTYDADGRPIQTTYNDGSFTTTSYALTSTGQTVSQARQELSGTSILTNNLYDIDGRLVEVDEPNPTTPTSASGKLITTYGYDIYGGETSQTDANGHTTTFTYDSEGRETGETLPGGTLNESTTYDSFGRESQTTDFDGNITVFDYFNSGVSAGQIEDEKFFAPGHSLSGTPDEETAYAYNNLQQQSTVTQSAAGSVVRTTAYTYDKDGNETSEIVTIPSSGTSQQLYHVYDPATDRLIETYTGNSNAASATTDTHYGYDALGRLASVTEYRVDGAATATDTLGSHNMYSANGSITTTTLPNTVYTFDSAGNLQSETLPDGITQTYGYDTLNRLTSETVKEGSNNIASFSYSLSVDGQRMSEIDNQYNTSGTLLYTNTYGWTYDGDNRLKSETLTAGIGSPDTSYTDAYTYDSVGNRLTKTHVVGTSTLSITDTYDSNGDDRLMTETASGAGAYSSSYSYDNNGSLIMETRTGAGPVTSNYTYDVQNHLISANIGGTTTMYTYDAQGDRVTTAQGSSTTYYTIDDNNPTGYTQVLELAASLGGTPTTTYVVGQAVLGQANSSGVLSYLVTDGHGSTRLLATTSGGITSRYDFDAFGNALTSTSGTQILYAGQFLDTSTGLYNMRARNYDPTTARFESFDPFAGYISNPFSLNKFIYAGANPVNRVDPGGEQFIDILVATGLDSLLANLQGSTGLAVLRSIEHGAFSVQIFAWTFAPFLLGPILGVFASGLGSFANGAAEILGDLIANLSPEESAAAEALVASGDTSEAAANLAVRFPGNGTVIANGGTAAGADVWQVASDGSTVARELRTLNPSTPFNANTLFNKVDAEFGQTAQIPAQIAARGATTIVSRQIILQVSNVTPEAAQAALAANEGQWVSDTPVDVVIVNTDTGAVLAAGTLQKGGS